jgi:hypothetical protein
MRQLLAEVFLVALAGSGLGLVVAAAASTAFWALPANLPRVEEIQLNWTLVGSAVFKRLPELLKRLEALEKCLQQR